MTVRLLVIDDDPTATLQALAQTDLDATCDTSADVVVYDCILCGGDLARVRGLRGSPIIYLVETPTDELEAEALEAGAFDVLPRSTTPTRLARRIRLAIKFGRTDSDAAQLREQLLKTLSHALRTPLHAIGLACDALREQIDDDSLRYLGAIDRAAARIEKLISE